MTLANILRVDAHWHRTLPADSELAQAIAVLARAQQNAVWRRSKATNELRAVLREYYYARAHRNSRCRGGQRQRGQPVVVGEIVRDGARQMLAVALQVEVAAYVAQFADHRDENGRRLVVRNGHHQPREVLTAAGAVEVTAPRKNDRRVDPDSGERQRFSSAILPAWARKSPRR